MCQLQHAGNQLGHHACALGVFVARIQRGQLDRNAGRGEHVCAHETTTAANRVDGIAIRLQIALRILHGERAFAEHVERIAVIGVVTLARTRQRLADGAAHDELVAHDLHRLAHGQTDHRLADAADQPFEGARHIGAGKVVELHQLAGEHQAPGGCVDQHRITATHVLFPVRLAQLVADQLVGGVLVGNAQQGFGHAHQQHAFFAAQIVLAHEGFDRALILGTCAHPGDQVGGQRLHLGLLCGRQARLLQQFTDVLGFVLEPGSGDGGTQGAGRGGQFGRQQRAREVGRSKRVWLGVHT